METINRRTFLKKTGLLGAGFLTGQHLMGNLLGIAPGEASGKDAVPDIIAVKGENPFTNTLAAIDRLGGIEKFVGRGDKVGLLVNSAFKNVGASVNPDIVLAVVQACLDAGAGEIRYLKKPHRGYWKRTPLAEKRADLIGHLQYESGGDVKVQIPGGVAIQDAKVTSALLETDVFINIAITKHHRGVHFTGTLKNMMGLCPFSTNSYFHFGTLKLGWFKDLDHLSQCIADLNLVRQTDLCISDATEFITESGPWGPGPLKRPDTVLASPDRVGLDAVCCRLLGHDPKDILMIQKAAAHGLGNADLETLRVVEVAV